MRCNLTKHISSVEWQIDAAKVYFGYAAKLIAKVMHSSVRLARVRRFNISARARDTEALSADRVQWIQSIRNVSFGKANTSLVNHLNEDAWKISPSGYQQVGMLKLITPTNDNTTTYDVWFYQPVKLYHISMNVHWCIWMN